MTATTLNPILTSDPLQLDAEEIFSQLPDNRAGQSERRYLDEILTAGFGNFESAGMLERFESSFAEKFGTGTAYR